MPLTVKPIYQAFTMAQSHLYVLIQWLLAKKAKIIVFSGRIMAHAHPLIRAEISGHSKHSLTSQRLIIGPL